jgi:WD40 repeat protein
VAWSFKWQTLLVLGTVVGAALLLLTQVEFPHHDTESVGEHGLISMAISPNGNLLAIGDLVGGIRCFDVEARNQFAFIQSTTSNECNPICFCGNDCVLLQNGNRIVRWDLNRQVTLNELLLADGDACSLSVSKSASTAAVGLTGKRFIVWNLTANSSRVFQIEQEPEEITAFSGVNCVHFLGDESRLAFLIHGQLFIVETSGGSLRTVRKNVSEGGRFLYLAYHGDTQTIATISRNGLIQLWDARGGAEIKRTDTKRFSVYGTLLFSHDGAYLVTSESKHIGGSAVIEIRGLGDLVVRRRFESYGGAVTGMVQANDGASLISCGRDGRIEFWNSDQVSIK